MEAADNVVEAILVGGVLLQDNDVAVPGEEIRRTGTDDSAADNDSAWHR